MLFELEDVSVKLGERTVLSSVGVAVAAGERLVLLGPNGCGKTTLLKAMAGLLTTSSGRIRYGGREVTARALEEPSFRRRFRGEVALLFQNVDAMLFCPTVADEVAFTPRQLGLADVPSRVAELAADLDLGELLARPPFELSGGEKKRVALAAVLAARPRVLLLDEPTANLDARTAARLIELLAGLTGATIVSATHNLSAAGDLGTRAIVLAAGTPGVYYDGLLADFVADERLLTESGLAHRHVHAHGAARHVHYHVHDGD